MRRRVIYHGRVQGVFFRATTRSLAGGFAVSGFVRNQPEGTVELVADGAEAEVTAFLAAVRERFAGNIEHADQTDQPEEGAAFKGFTVRR